MTDTLELEGEAVAVEVNPYDAKVNYQWPPDLPALTDDEAIAAVKLLLRKFKVKTSQYRFRIGTGNRHTWPRGGVYTVNPSKGWRSLVHLTSHWAHHKLNPRCKPHHWRHLQLEKDMTALVLESGWLDGKLRKPEQPQPTLDDKRRKKLAAITARIETWRKKRDRAMNALEKLHSKRKYYERQLAA